MFRPSTLIQGNGISCTVIYRFPQLISEQYIITIFFENFPMVPLHKIFTDFQHLTHALCVSFLPAIPCEVQHLVFSLYTHASQKKHKWRSGSVEVVKRERKVHNLLKGYIHIFMIVHYCIQKFFYLQLYEKHIPCECRGMAVIYYHKLL